MTSVSLYGTALECRLRRLVRLGIIRNDRYESRQQNIMKATTDPCANEPFDIIPSSRALKNQMISVPERLAANSLER